jgi:AcrR family transcriptional regulator
VYRISRVTRINRDLYGRTNRNPVHVQQQALASRAHQAGATLSLVAGPASRPGRPVGGAGYRGQRGRQLTANRPGGGEIVASRTLIRPPGSIQTASQVGTRAASQVGTRTARKSARIVATAARWIYEGRRLDMQGLADELGVSRVTLFRRVGSREELLSQALWLLTERVLEVAAARWEAERPEGELHTPGTGRHINALVSQSEGLRRLLDDEPTLTIRVLTDPRGRVQTGIVAFIEELLCRDVTEFGLVTLIEPGALAYALVRLGESFLYADVLAARKPDVATANRLQQALVEGILP